MRKAPAEIEWDDNMGEGQKFHEAGWRALQVRELGSTRGLREMRGEWPLKRKGESMVEPMNRYGV
jgi:hypothetical protein